MAKKQAFEFFFNQLVKGYRSIMGKDPEGLDLIKIKQEARQKLIDQDKVIEVQFGKPFSEEISIMDQINKSKNKIEGASNKIDEIMNEQADMYRPKTDAEIKAKFDKQNKESIERLKKKKEDDPGFYTGGMVDVEPNLSDIGHGSDALMARTRLVSPDGQATTSTGLNYLLAEDNDNIRVPFGSGKKVYDYNSFEHKINELNAHYKRYKKQGGTIPFEIFSEAFAKENFAEGGRIGFAKGKLADAARRKFLKLAGSGAAGLAALKTGLLGFGKEAAPVVEKAAETVSNTMGEAPAYFLNLVKKIKNLGSEYSPKYSGGREKITNYKDYTLTEDLTTGETTIQRFKQSEVDYYDEMLMEENYMNYRPGMADETTKGKTPPGEYTEDTGYLRTSGPSKGDVIIEGEPIPKDIIEEGTMFEDNMTEFGKTKKADGGRIGFESGKIVLGKKIYDLLKNNKKIREAVDNIFKSGDYKYDAEIAAESLVELNPKAFGNKLYDDLDDATRMEIYGAVLPEVRGGSKIKPYDKTTEAQFNKDVDEAGGMEKFLDNNPISDDINVYSNQYLNKLDQEIIDSGLYTKEEWAKLGEEAKEARRKSFDSNYADAQEEMVEVKKVAPQMTERLELKAKYPGITDDLLDKILVDDNPQRKAEVLATIDEAFKMMEKGKGTDEIIETFKNTTRTKQASGGLTSMLGE